jgi:serine/threonine protein kinase
MPVPKDFEEVKFEELIGGWKKAMSETEHIVEYYNHWYEDKYIYVVMEYCSNGDLSQLILNKIKQKEKFPEKVFYF